MIFQFGFRGGGGFQGALYWLEYWGLRDLILPFILIFTIIFAVMQRIKLFEGKKFNVAIAGTISLLTVLPHVTGGYPQGYDIVHIINQGLPGTALLFVVIVLLMIMVGLVGGGVPQKTGFTSILAVVSGIILVGFFVSAIRPIPIISSIDPSMQALIIILLIFGLIVMWVTGEDKPQGERKGLKEWFWEEMSGGNSGKKGG